MLFIAICQLSVNETIKYLIVAYLVVVPVVR